MIVSILCACMISLRGIDSLKSSGMSVQTNYPSSSGRYFQMELEHRGFLVSSVLWEIICILFFPSSLPVGHQSWGFGGTLRLQYIKRAAADVPGDSLELIVTCGCKSLDSVAWEASSTLLSP